MEKRETEIIHIDEYVGMKVEFSVWYPENYRTYLRREKLEHSPGAYKEWMLKEENRDFLRDNLPKLIGKKLGCDCGDPSACHAPVLVELIDELFSDGFEPVKPGKPYKTENIE